MTVPRNSSATAQLADPLPAFNFFISLDPADAHLPARQAALIPVVALGAFAEAKGLGAELKIEEYAEGGVNDFAHLLPMRHTWGRITLRRGLIRDVALWAWYQAGLNGSLGARRDGCIAVCDETGDAAVVWSFRRALATRWIGPDLHASQSAAAIDGLEIAHEGLEVRAIERQGRA